MAWRAIVFFPLGVVLQTIGSPIFVILQFYAFYYLLAAAAAMLPSAALLATTMGWTILGPWLFLTIQDPSLSSRGRADTLSDPIALLSDIAFSGAYPLLTWAPPLLVGVLIGRADLRDRVTRWVLAVGGTLVAATAYTLSEIARALAPAGAADSPWLLAEGHTGAPLNVVGATGVAVGVMGVCLLLGSALPRLMWPLTAAGQLALTIYVVQVFVFWLFPDAVISRAGPADATFRVLRFYVPAVLAAMLWRTAFSRGPLEALLALPFTTRATPRVSTPAQVPTWHQAIQPPLAPPAPHPPARSVPTGPHPPP